MGKMFVVLLPSVMLVCQCAYCEGLDTLIELGRSQGEIEKSYKEETNTFKEVSRAVDGGAIKTGQTAGEIKRKYGEPVVVFPDKESGMDKWIYKPAKSTFFEGAKIYLLFDTQGVLRDIKRVK